MKKDKTQIVTGLLIFSVLVFIIIQILLIINSYELEKKKFDFKSREIIAGNFYRLNPNYRRLLKVADELDKSGINDTAQIKNVVKWALSDYGRFEENIRNSFKRNEITINFNCAISVNEFYLISSDGVKKELINKEKEKSEVILFGDAKIESSFIPANSFYYKSTNYYLRINAYLVYSDESLYLLGQMRNVFLISFVASLMVFGIFYYTLKAMKTQKKLNEMKSDFINNITHEFNTPLNTIKVAGTNLKNEQTKNSPDKVEQLADIVIRQNARLQKLIEDVMNASVLEEEKLLLNYTDVDLCELVTTAAFDIKIKYEEHEIDFTIESPGEVICRCDEFQIMSAVYNLIDNAAKYSPDKSKLDIVVKREDKTVALCITDQGIGISGEDQKHIFEKFFRTHTGKFASVKGLGLGLYFVKKIITAHSGSIEVVSSPGKGSRFIIHLPAAK